jgi:hypothetical protein
MLGMKKVTLLLAFACTFALVSDGAIKSANRNPENSCAVLALAATGVMRARVATTANTAPLKAAHAGFASDGKV